MLSSDSESDSDPDVALIYHTLSAENMSRWLSLKGPIASLYRVRHALNEGRYHDVFESTQALLKLSQTKIGEPIKFILG